VTPTAFGFTSLVSILYSTSSPYARVITVNHRQSRALARQKSPGVSAFRSPVPRVGGAFSHFRNVSSHLPQRTEPHRLDGRLMHEDLFRAIIRDDEPEPLRRVEPLHLRRRGARRARSISHSLGNHDVRNRPPRRRVSRKLRRPRSSSPSPSRSPSRAFFSSTDRPRARLAPCLARASFLRARAAIAPAPRTRDDPRARARRVAVASRVGVARSTHGGGG